MISRRNFINSLAALTVGAGALTITGGGMRSRLGHLFSPPHLKVRDLTPETYAALVGTHLSIHSASGAKTRAKLVDVSEHGRVQRPAGRRLTQMSLLFEVPNSTRITDGTHRVAHPLGGSCDLYLNEVGPAGRVRQFEAVISRMA